MFGKIAAFELRYQLRQPIFWISGIAFFLLVFAAIAVDVISIGSGGGGGGGSFDWWLLLLGLLPLALPGPRRRKPARVRGRVSPDSPLREWQEASISAVRSQRRRRRQNFPQ